MIEIVSKPIKPIVAESVPCNGCTLCCRNDMILLHPECGDRASDFITQEVAHPFTGRPSLMLAKKPGPDGKPVCIYLGDTGCTIHGRAPAICRELDCGKMYSMLPRGERRRHVRMGIVDQAVLDQGARVQRERGL